jgi:Recombinational DNA repair ATPase (RecF pathway)
MENNYFRLLSIELTNIKNVKHGIANFSEEKNFLKGIYKDSLKSGILGIYGPNGSGKTAIIDSILFLRLYLLDADSLKSRNINLKKITAEFLNNSSDNGSIVYNFSYKRNDDIFLIIYEINIRKDEKNVFVSNEKLAFRQYNEQNKYHKWQKYGTAFNIDYQNTKINETLNSVAIENKTYKKILTDLFVIKQLAFNYGNSTILNESFISHIHQNNLDNKIIPNNDFVMISSLKNYIDNNFYVFTQDDYSAVMNGVLPVSFAKRSNDGTQMSGGFDVAYLFSTNSIDQEEYDSLNDSIEIINTIMPNFIKDFCIRMNLISISTGENNEKIYTVDFSSILNGNSVPLRNESDGIKKLISLIGFLSAVFNNNGVFLAVDELDSGIFEYLLGQLLEVISDYGKGQLLFTSHNLRCLEVLDQKNILFTTTNPSDRYVHFSPLKKSNNFRDKYIRAIQLGGQKEEMYNETDENNIAVSFMKCGANNSANKQ